MLGSCQKCHGPLCVSNQTVACQDCGEPVPDHPKMAEWAAARKAAKAARPAPAIVVRHEDYPANRLEQLDRLEKLVAQQAKAIGQLMTRLSMLEQKTGLGGKAKHKAG